MSVFFLLGASGSGKSTALRDLVIRKSLEDPASRHIVFVPEQSTFTTQQAFIAGHPRQAMLNIEVISFGHLAQRVFREFSAEKAQVLGENGKRMLLALAAGDCRDSLRVYAKQAARPGFLAKLGSLFAEWDMNGISPERLEEIAGEEKIKPLLSLKLKDLAAIYRAFKERLGEGRATAEETLPRLLKLLPRSDAARGASLYFDGFTGFTTVQYSLITQLIRRSRDSYFVFTLPKAEAHSGKHSGKEGLFAMSAAAIRSIERCAEEAGKLVKGTVYAEDGTAPAVKKPDLDFLEKHLMRFGKDTYAEAPEHIEAVACRNARTECRAAVLEAVRLAREEGCAWREIAITVGDKERYVPALEEDLKEAGIPYFTDRRAPLGRHPLIRLAEAALDAVTGNFDRDSVLRYLKNECGPLSREESDRFENYLLAAGIRGGRKRMTEPYERLARERFETDEAYELRKAETLSFMNGCRVRAMTPLLKLQETVMGGASAGEMAAAVLAFMDELGVEEKIERRAALCREAGALAGEDEWKGALDSVKAFFEEMRQLLSEMPVSGKDFCALAKSGLDGLKLGRLPSEPDQLVIGDVERSRYNDVKALLVLGLNEGLIPAGGRSSGIITDRERVELEQYESDLGYTDERALLEERFYIYRLLTRPSEKLYLSFSQTGADGKEVRRSPVMSEIEGLFPNLPVRDYGELCRTEPLRAVAGEESAARVLAEQIRRKQNNWDELYGLLSQSPGSAARLEKLEQGALRYYRPVPLTDEQAEALFGRVLRGSVTRLERFAECAYRHFLQYGLGLSEREEFNWEAADHGTFFHKVMETILKTVREEKRTLRELSAEEREALIRKGIEAASGPETALQEKAESDYLLERWKDLFTRQIDAMAGLEPEDGFRPEAFELRFGGGNDAVVLDLGGGRRMNLSGQIDRLDVWKDGDTDWIRIVDYKTSDHGIDCTDLHAGLQLQLFTYLSAALGLQRKAGKNAKAGGLYYGILTDKWTEEETEDPERIEKKLWMEHRLGGLTASEVKAVSGDVRIGNNNRNGAPVPSDMLEKICGYVRDQEIRLGREILAGKISAEPAERGKDSRKNACTYCEFKSVCRFDERIPGMKRRTFDPYSQQELLQEIAESAEGKEAAT